MAMQDDYNLTHRPFGGPGQSVDSTEKNGMTRSASAEIQFGAALMVTGSRMVGPLVPGGTFAGIAKAARIMRYGVGTYERYDNVPLQDEGNWTGVADKAFPAGSGLNWNSSTLRWTNLAPGGAVVATPGVEAADVSNGGGHEIPVKIRRIRT